MRLINLVGMRFGMWTVIHRANENAIDGSAKWICRCDCGTTRAVQTGNLRNGTSRSCGCIHGMDFSLNTDEDRFWAKVDKNGPIPEHAPELGRCWIWMASHSRKYGNMQFRGSVKRTNRISWIIHNGEIPKGICILHRCDNPLCVNPAHLFTGTNYDNVIDRMKKGRGSHPVGELCGNSKLSIDKVNEIRKLHIENPKRWTYGALSNKFSTCRTNIRNIITRKTWKHI